MKSVFILWHTHKFSAQEEDSKVIGVYESREAAQLAQEKTRILPGFADHPDGFEIAAYEVGVDYWTKGFVTKDGKTHER